MKRCYIMLLWTILTVGPPAMSWAFSTNGATWGGADTTLSLNTTSFPAGSTLNTNAQLAMSDWNAVTGAAFRFFVNATNCDPGSHLPTSDNCVAFVSGVSLNGALGVTTTSSLFGTMLNADIMLNANVSWTPGLSVGDFSFGPPFSFRGVARHEFGHALGLCHEDRTGNVVLMNSVYTAGGVKPANPHGDDRNGVRSLYPGAGTERDLIAYMWKKTTNDVQGCDSSSTVAVPVNSVPARANVGDAVTLEFSFENAGNLASGSFDIAFLLSTNTIISLADTLIGENFGASAPAHSRGTFTRTLTIPAGTPLGTFFLGLCLDHHGAIAEANEGNNCAVAPGSITITNLPDLVMSAVNAPTSALPGQTITVSNTVRNAGTLAAGSFRVGFYLSADTTCTTADTFLTSRLVPGLAAGASSSANTSVTLPGSTTAGTRQLCAIADDLNGVGEPREGNNAAFASLTVLPPFPVLNVTRIGSGTVISSPAGINCGLDCTEAYANGTVVTLTPRPSSGWAFQGWTGAADCADGVVTMTKNTTCRAVFENTSL